MIKLISKTDGKIAVTLLVLGAVLLLAVFMTPITRVYATHCTGGATTPCTEDVRNTKHNLAQNTDILASGTTEVCIFCHTPHGARSVIGTAPTGQAPLWNRAVKTAASYSMYNSPNFDNVDNSVSSGPRGVSLACLSCHDGTISFDALINPPGSGGFIPSNLTDTAGSGTRMTGMTFTGPGADTDANGTMDEAQRPQQLTGGTLGGLNNFVFPSSASSPDGMTPYPNLTLDLRDDHPISMQMPGAAGEDPQFRDVFINSASNLDGLGVEGTNIRFVSRYAAADRIWSTDKRDRIRLYPSSSAANVSEYVECASCHNPHTPRTTFLRLPTINKNEFTAGSPADFTGGGFGTTLVRTPPFTPIFNNVAGQVDDLSHAPNQGSLVCLSCHQK